MNLVEAVIDAFNKYATFAGRTRRTDFWWFTVFLALVYGLVYLLDTATAAPVFGAFALLAFILPSLSVTVRRLHDSDHAAWWLLLVFIPIVGTIGLLLMAVLPGTSGENRYGPAPEMPDW